MLRRSLADLDLSHYHEAVGDLLQMELIIDRPTSESEGGKRQTWEDLPKVISHLPTNPLLPPIHFHGSSAQATGELTHPSGSPHSFVRGTVQLTADNPPEVRWTIVIRYGGEDRWKVEGVQVGGRGSKRGFFGVSALGYYYECELIVAGVDGCGKGGTLSEWTCVVLEGVSGICTFFVFLSLCCCWLPSSL